ncbi:gamma-glutamylcyclotransferase family protein [Elioraea rosea]|uniref:gamma-glutamylcyclotransferase family protein n=1 Tax=Elioraea rosea TaxID=2492390 RepID=UPI00118615A1|nr:gamma-glutamylcyclotransferase family protein [Elioraea rosea]
MRVFLYGSLMDPAVFARRAGTAEPLASARPGLLEGWRRVTLRGTPFPTLLRAAGEAVDGLVADIPPALLPPLHAYEGALYRFLRVRVLSEGQYLAARAWISRPDRADARRPWSPRPTSEL